MIFITIGHDEVYDVSLFVVAVTLDYDEDPDRSFPMWLRDTA